MEEATTIRDIMTTSVISLHENDPLKIVNITFKKHSFHHIPIVDSFGSIKGIVSKDDILRLSIVRSNYNANEFERIKAKDFMTRKILTLRPKDSIKLAADILLTNTFHAIPVVENNKIIGIITTYDLIKHAYS